MISGYYRVNYDAQNWNLIVEQLKSDLGAILLNNRAQLMDDGLNVARVNAVPYSIPLNMARYLVNEREYAPWKAALNAFSYLDLMFVKSDGYGAFKVRHTTL